MDRPKRRVSLWFLNLLTWQPGRGWHYSFADWRIKHSFLTKQPTLACSCSFWSLLVASFAIYYADCYMRYLQAEETISAQDGYLVSECPHTYFRRRKSIPLPAIRIIKPHTNHSRLPNPNTLRVFYGHGRRYRFDTFMTPGQGGDLVNGILQLRDNERWSQHCICNLANGGTNSFFENKKLIDGYLCH